MFTLNPVLLLFKKMKTNNKLFFVITSLFLIFSVVFSFLSIGKISRDKEILEDVYALKKVIQANQIVSVEKELYKEWNFQFYLLRYCEISIQPHDKPKNYLITKKDYQSEILAEYQQVEIKLNNYYLYKLKIKP
jgi:hypothetical protein